MSAVEGNYPERTVGDIQYRENKLAKEELNTSMRRVT
jgi:hypothetical protein